MPTREPRPETRRITEEGKAACVAFFVLHREGLKDRLPVDGELTKWIEYNKLVRTHKLNRSQVKLQFTKWRSGVAQDQGRGPRQGDKALRASLSKRLESCEGGLKQIFKNVATIGSGSGGSSTPGGGGLSLAAASQPQRPLSNPSVATPAFIFGDASVLDDGLVG